MVKVCGNCGYRGEPNNPVGGSCLIELILWCFFIIPGIIYSIWRAGSRKESCPKCGAKNMLPLGSPVAQKMIGQQTRKCPFCAEEVLVAALKCKHCGSDLSPPDPASVIEKASEPMAVAVPEMTAEEKAAFRRKVNIVIAVVVIVSILMVIAMFVLD